MSLFEDEESVDAYLTVLGPCLIIDMKQEGMEDSKEDSLLSMLEEESVLELFHSLYERAFEGAPLLSRKRIVIMMSRIDSITACEEAIFITMLVSLDG